MRAHWRCTSRSPAVATMPDGANIVDGTGSSSLSGLPPPRIALNITTIAANTTITTTAAKMTDSVPWMKVFLMTSAS